LVVLVITAGVAVGLVLTRAFDPRLSPDEAARQLREHLGVDWTFVCTPSHNDGSLPADVDYLCEPSLPEEVGYWLGTDRSGIEIVARTG